MSLDNFLNKEKTWNISVCFFLAYVFFASVGVNAQAITAGDEETTEVEMAKGQAAFKNGDFATALVHWTSAIDRFKAQSAYGKLSDALTYRAQALQALGRYRIALRDQKNALVIAKQARDSRRVAAVQGSLGNAYLLSGSISEARRQLEESISLAKDIEAQRLAAVSLNNLGNLFFYEQLYEEALSRYKEAINLTENTNADVLLVKVLINAARASIQIDQLREAEALLGRATDTSQLLEASHDKAFGLIAIGRLLQQLSDRLPQSGSRMNLLTYRVFVEAEQIALELGDLRSASLAAGYLGQLYEGENRYNESLQLTNLATFRAQQISAPELLYRWQWQTGRLLKAQGKTDSAASAFRLAVNNLQSIRQDITSKYTGNRLSFRDTVGLVFYEFVELLLQQEKAAYRPEDKARYLKEARDTIEALKSAELQDYFLDDCVVEQKSKIAALEAVAPGAAIIYPILFADRIELLLSISDRIERYTVDVSLSALTVQVRHLRRRLQRESGRRYLRHAYKIYSWLVLPIEQTLAAHNIDTLVIVPDGPLRTIPMAALHDGQQLLIHRFGIVTTPGLSLTDPRPLRSEAVQALGAGLSKSVQGYSALPGVASELEAIEKMYGGTRLQDEAFITQNLRKELTDTPYSIVHVATHARFESNVRKSFLLTYDGNLNLDQLEEIVGLSQYRDQPVELLTLSACQTALGDDRAALGLAGVAVKSGARSALATLWNVSDKATSLLVTEFYRQLTDLSLSKAEALRRAQLKLVNDTRFQHPAFWSPFLLIGNWL